MILHPELLIERLNLEGLLITLGDALRTKTEALLRVINVGLAMLEVRLPTSEFAGRDLPGHVWAVYDIPGRKRLSLGYDGFRRGTSLSTATLGVFTLTRSRPPRTASSTSRPPCCRWARATRWRSPPVWRRCATTSRARRMTRRWPVPGSRRCRCCSRRTLGSTWARPTARRRPR
ncbi:hypothetical protein [Alloactinosynnema sp. L-07]|nr:hypothetical protein [Alloactinosynnema sp. L-07]